MAPPPQQSTYVSSSGHLTSQLLTKRVYDALSDYAEIAYLFVDTLVSPIVNPRSAIPQGQQPGTGRGDGRPDRGLGGAWGRGGAGGRGGGGGGGGNGGGGGFMSMTDLRGGPTVNACGAASSCG